MSAASVPVAARWWSGLIRRPGDCAVVPTLGRTRWWPVSDLPSPPSPRGAYVPATVHGTLAFSAGMTPRVHGELAFQGRVGSEVSVADAQRAAGIAATNALAAIAARVGGLEGIETCVRMVVYVAAASDFTEFAGLPGGAPVEVELTAALRTGYP
jgi:enamine deaminase RidA (YjgF/YER057c/UK114 family)